MWPKMLLELLPHLTRLVPMWDRFLQGRAASDKATEAALASMAASAEGVRNDLAQMTAAHASLYRQLQDQSAQIAGLGEEVRLARESAERLEKAPQVFDPAVAPLAGWVKGGVIAIVLLLLGVIALQLLHHA